MWILVSCRLFRVLDHVFFVTYSLNVRERITVNLLAKKPWKHPTFSLENNKASLKLEAEVFKTKLLQGG